MSPRPAELIPARAAPVFAALGDATRLSLLSRLRDGRPRSIVQLTEGLGLTRQGVSKHLRVLERAGMVRSERSGRESRFVFEPAGVEQARGYLDRASRQWDRALARLRAFVEDT
jgi:DNA-binding transcriptional ArsR family regulator